VCWKAGLEEESAVVPRPPSIPASGYRDQAGMLSAGYVASASLTDGPLPAATRYRTVSRPCSEIWTILILSGDQSGERWFPLPGVSTRGVDGSRTSSTATFVRSVSPSGTAIV
jgi:hypothetical protein